MKNGFLVLLLAICMSPICAARSPQSKASVNKIADRDLSRYEKTGPYVVRSHPESDRIRLEAEIRDFLWKLWSSCRLGMLVATGFNLEGDPTTSTYFVEPDSEGRWVIHVEAISIIAALLAKGEELRRMKHEETYSDVARVELLDNNPAQQIPIPNEDSRTPEKYKLRLKQEGITTIRFL